VSFSTNIDQSSAIAARVKEQAQVKIAVGVPFISDADLQAAVDAYSEARLDGLRAALAILALLAMCALFAAQRIPETQPGGVKS
jgi:hypothetical protein